MFTFFALFHISGILLHNGIDINLSNFARSVAAVARSRANLQIASCPTFLAYSLRDVVPEYSVFLRNLSRSQDKFPVIVIVSCVVVRKISSARPSIILCSKALEIPFSSDIKLTATEILVVRPATSQLSDADTPDFNIFLEIKHKNNIRDVAMPVLADKNIPIIIAPIIIKIKAILSITFISLPQLLLFFGIIE